MSFQEVLSSKQMYEVEAKAYGLGFLDADFMETAGFLVADQLKKHIDECQLKKSVLILAGEGNNAGDGFVAGVYLLKAGYEVTAFQPNRHKKNRPLCEINKQKFLQKGGKFLDSLAEFSASVILDALFGIGFKGPVEQPYETAILEVNKSQVPIISLDIPSGLNATTGEVSNVCIQATKTLSLGYPKIGFFLNQGWKLIGELIEIDFGLPKHLAKELHSDYLLLNETSVAQFLPTISKTRHKYEAGYTLGLAGSKSMPGAALLSSQAALKAGSGIVKLLYEKGLETLFAFSPYELIKVEFSLSNKKPMIELINQADSIFIGPGLSRTKEVGALLSVVLENLKIPSVLDADALWFIASNPSLIPKNAILSPHLGEMQRLLQKNEHLKLNEALMSACRHYTQKYQTTLILKGSPSFIFHPNHPIFISPTGDPGMATAGSGDVLTGILASLQSQGLTCLQASLLGTFLHGLAGECAAKDLTSYCLTASDLISYLPKSYKSLNKKRNPMMQHPF